MRTGTALTSYNDMELGAMRDELAKQLAIVEREEEQRRKAERQRREELDSEATLCVVCQDEARRLVFMPCRHLACCGTCGGNLTHCPLCRTAIDKRWEVFL